MSLCFATATPRLEALCGEDGVLMHFAPLGGNGRRAASTGGKAACTPRQHSGPPAPGPPRLPPASRPLLKPAASRLPGGGSRPLRRPAHVEPFPVRPPPSASPIRTWPSPEGSQCASGQTYWLQPTSLGVLASRVASNLSFLPPQSRSAASLEPLLRLACFPRPANRSPIYYFSAGSRESQIPLNGC